MSFCSSLDFDLLSTYSFDEESERLLNERRKHEAVYDENRAEVFKQIWLARKAIIFRKPGLKIIRFTSLKIKFSFSPADIYKGISKRNVFYCTFMYLKHFKKWHITREPMPAQPLYRIVTSNEILIKDSTEEIFKTILNVYEQLNNWAIEYIQYKANKYKRYKEGYLKDRDLNSEDEELFFSPIERQQLHERRKKIWQRMIPPN